MGGGKNEKTKVPTHCFLKRNKIVRWHHWLSGHEFEQTLGDGEGQGTSCCRGSWGYKELDTTEQLNNHETLQVLSCCLEFSHMNTPSCELTEKYTLFWAVIGLAKNSIVVEKKEKNRCWRWAHCLWYIPPQNLVPPLWVCFLKELGICGLNPQNWSHRSCLALGWSQHLSLS